MPSRSDKPRDHGDALHDPVRSRAITIIVQGLKKGFLKPDPGMPESDYASTATAVLKALEEAGLTLVAEQPKHDLVAVVQTALRDESTLHRSPTRETGWTSGMYLPSPGQLLDHVHHRIARLAVDAIRRLDQTG